MVGITFTLWLRNNETLPQRLLNLEANSTTVDSNFAYDDEGETFDYTSDSVKVRFLLPEESEDIEEEDSSEEEDLTTFPVGY